MLSLLLRFSPLLLGFSRLANAQLDPGQCPLVDDIAYVYSPLVINAYIAQNTVINIEGDAVITINNAPTSLDTTVTITTTLTGTGAASSTLPSSEASVTPLPGDLPYILSIIPTIRNPLDRYPRDRKRQNTPSTFIGGDGNGTVSDCGSAQTYSLVGGQLLVNDQPVSTRPDVGSAPLAPMLGGSITSTFGFTPDGTLAWTNESFVGGTASFCRNSGGVVVAVFDPAQTPEGCIPVKLGMVSGKLPFVRLVDLYLIFSRRFMSGSEYLLQWSHWPHGSNRSHRPHWTYWASR